MVNLHHIALGPRASCRLPPPRRPPLQLRPQHGRAPPARHAGQIPTHPLHAQRGSIVAKQTGHFQHRLRVHHHHDLCL